MQGPTSGWVSRVRFKAWAFGRLWGFLDFTESDRLHDNSQDYCGTNQNLLAEKTKTKKRNFRTLRQVTLHL